MERLAERWVKAMTRAPASRAAELDHYIEVQYEDLVRDTEPTLRADLRVHRAALGRPRC